MSANQATLTDFRNRYPRGFLPDREVTWAQKPITAADNLKIVVPTNGNNSTGTLPDKYLAGRNIPENAVGYVVDGEQPYRDHYERDTRSVPRTYSEIDPDSTQHLLYETTANRYAGAGIDGVLMETAIRFANDAGRYSADDFTLVNCGDNPFLLTAPDGTFAYAPFYVDYDSSIEFTAEHEVRGMLIRGEEDRRVLTELTRVLDTIETHTGKVADTFVTRTAGTLVFRATDDSIIEVDSATFDKSHGVTDNMSRVLGEHMFLPDDESTDSFSYTVEADDIDYRPGETTDTGQIVLGHRVRSNPNVSRGTLRRVDIEKTTAALDIADHDTEDGIYAEVVTAGKDRLHTVHP